MEKLGNERKKQKAIGLEKLPSLGQKKEHIGDEEFDDLVKTYEEETLQHAKTMKINAEGVKLDQTLHATIDSIEKLKGGTIIKDPPKPLATGILGKVVMEDTEALERNGMANKLIEKYLKISDFLKHILNNPDIFLDQKYEGVQTKAEERRILLEFLKLFLLTVQDSIDYEQTIKVAIE